jgi:hypothetical protein
VEKATDFPSGDHAALTTFEMFGRWRSELPNTPTLQRLPSSIERTSKVDPSGEISSMNGLFTGTAIGAICPPATGT